MTVAAKPQLSGSRRARLQQLAPHLDGLILAGRQLELDADEVIDALRNHWEKTNG